jgi:hypothetical protein
VEKCVDSRAKKTKPGDSEVLPTHESFKPSSAFKSRASPLLYFIHSSQHSYICTCQALKFRTLLEATRSGSQKQMSYHQLRPSTKPKRGSLFPSSSQQLLSLDLQYHTSNPGKNVLQTSNDIGRIALGAVVVATVLS